MKILDEITLVIGTDESDFSHNLFKNNSVDLGPHALFFEDLHENSR